MAKNYQSGCEWEDNEIDVVMLQHDHNDHWVLNGFKKDGTVESAKVSHKAARILLANGIAFGN